MAIGTTEHPLRVAIVGSGPAGFYAAGHLLKCKSHPDLCVQVDMFDRLPTPWGLVRAGVAPDHPNIKAVSRVYEKTAEHPEFRFYGNVELGRDISHDDLTSRYHAVIYAVGAQTDRRMGIPGEDLPGSWAATEFVAWYNGHPDYRDLVFDLSAERAIVVGNGNVATDVARMLALTRDELAATDVADHALDVLAESNVKEIVVLGRRGPAQAAFTNPELLELGDMTDADVFVDPGDVELDPLSKAFIESEAAHNTAEEERPDPQRVLDARAGGQAAPHRAALPRLARGDPRRASASRASDSSTTSWWRATTARCARGPRTSPRSSTAASCSARSATAARGSRASRSTRDAARSRTSTGASTGRTGEYAVGWIKRGPTGIIGTNKRDAQETVDSVLADLDAGPARPRPADPDRDSLEALIAERQPDAVSYAGWQAVDRVEREAGEPQGRPRVKLCSFEELLEAAKDATPAP